MLSWNLEVRGDAKMIARPHTADRFVEDTSARANLKRRSPVRTTPHEDVVDPPERPVPIGHQRIARREGVTRVVGMSALPRISITHAGAVQGLPSRPEEIGRAHV